MPSVIFTREQGAGLTASAIWVSGTLLDFTNEKASLKVSASQSKVRWIMFGTPGSSLTLKAKVGGVETTVIDGAKIPPGEVVHESFKFVSFGG